MDLYVYLPLVAFAIAGLVIGGLILTLSKLPGKKPNPVKNLPYESGILATTPVRQRFPIDFYMTAMLFIIFDIELAFLYPVAVVMRDNGIIGLVLFLVFVVTVLEALIYVWRKGALQWR